MTKFEKFATVVFIAVALIGTNRGWLPGIWAVIFVLIGAAGLDKWAILKLRQKNEES